MSIKPPLEALHITLAENGFYEGANKTVAIGSKILIIVLVLWATVFSDQAGAFLKSINAYVNANFGTWYLYVVAFYVLVCICVALWPSTGKVRLGAPDQKPEFSRFSWFAMMFGAGISVGMLTYSTAEPIFHMANNPDIILGNSNAESMNGARDVFKWTFLHWGLSAWGTYSLIGLALAFFSYSRNLPLTMRSTLTPLFGRALSGPLGNIIDILSIIATILGVSVSLGYGVSQLASGVFYITGIDAIMDKAGSPTNIAMIIALLVVIFASTLSALSGVGKGIKWLSNINMGMSFFLLIVFLVVGATVFALKSFFIGIWDYIVAFPKMAITFWPDDGTQTGKALSSWQKSWTIFYWAWWIAFAPFVGLFFARISKGRSIREYIFGAMIVPTAMCFVWFAILGGTAMDLEIAGTADGVIKNAGLSSQLFASISVLFSPLLAKLMSILVVILLLTYLVTSADSAILIINTISGAGSSPTRISIHIIFWGTALAAVISTLLLAGGLDAINSAMLVGALPFSAIVGLMGVSLIKALTRDGIRMRDVKQEKDA